MKSIRLNTSIRYNIISAMMKKWEETNPCPYDTGAMGNKIALDIWNSNFGKLPIKKIPELFFKHSYGVKVQVGETVKTFTLAESKPVPWISNSNTAIIEIFDQPTPAMIKLADARQKVSEWNQEKSSFREEITLIIEGFNTTKQLVETWPEAEQYLPPFAADPSKGINLPALVTSRLNEKLGIKP